MTADRGKGLESEFSACCRKHEAKIAFTWYRYPDAKAGSRKVSPADFQTAINGKVRLIEAKETATEGRLPYGNFKPDQVARMRLWQFAGIPAYVLILHTKSRMYRVLPINFFEARDESKGSWFFDEKKVQLFCTQSRDFRCTFKTCEEAFNFIHGL